MKENDRSLRKIGRDLDREQNKLSAEEKKLVGYLITKAETYPLQSRNDYFTDI